MLPRGKERDSYNGFLPLISCAWPGASRNSGFLFVAPCISYAGTSRDEFYNAEYNGGAVDFQRERTDIFLSNKKL